MTRRTALSLMGTPALVSAPALAQVPAPPKSRLPRPASEFAIQMADGGNLLLSSFKGKAIVVEFLLTTCPHCQKCSQIMQKLYKEYGPRGFQPVGIAVNDMAKMLIPDYLRNFQLTFPVGVGMRDAMNNFLEYPSILMMSFPTVVGIDKKWAIREQHMGGTDFFKDEEKNMRAMVESLLTTAAVAPAAKKTAAKAS